MIVAFQGKNIKRGAQEGAIRDKSMWSFSPQGRDSSRRDQSTMLNIAEKPSKLESENYPWNLVIALVRAFSVE